MKRSLKMSYFPAPIFVVYVATNEFSLQVDRHSPALFHMNGKNISVFSVRLGGKRIYRCSCPLFPTDQKIAFLTKFYEAVSKGILDTQIETFCENEVKRKEIMRKKNNEKKKEERAEEKRKKAEKLLAEAKAKEEAAKHLPKA